MTEAEKDFLTEYTRSLLVGWCAQCITGGGNLTKISSEHMMFLEHAIEKGWVSKTSPHRILAKGYSAAAAYLRR